MQQILAHICDRGGGFVEAISFLAEKETVSLFHSSALRVFVSVGRQCFRFLIELVLIGYLIISINAVTRN